MTEYAVDMDLSWEEIAILYAMKKWLHGTDRVAGIPNAEQLREHVLTMVEQLEQEKQPNQTLFNSSGRFTVHSDPEMPDSYEIHLFVGHIDRQMMEAVV